MNRGKKARLRFEKQQAQRKKDRNTCGDCSNYFNGVCRQWEEQAYNVSPACYKFNKSPSQ